MAVIRKGNASRARTPAAPPAPDLDYQSNIAGFRHPQFVPGQPHRLPGLVRGFVLPIGATGPAPVSGNAGLVTPGALQPGQQIPVWDPHHYWNVASGNLTAPVAGAGALNNPFLTGPQGLRNMLTLRCPAANTGNVYIDFGQAASALSPYKIEADQTILFDEGVPQGDLFCFGDAAGQILVYAYSNIAAPV